MKQLVELHKAAEQAMRGLIVRMWPGEPLPGSYFGLVRRLANACPRFEVIKRSVCIEAARRAFARAKVHWAKLDAEKLVKEGLSGRIFGILISQKTAFVLTSPRITVS